MVMVKTKRRVTLTAYSVTTVSRRAYALSQAVNMAALAPIAIVTRSLPPAYHCGLRVYQPVTGALD